MPPDVVAEWRACGALRQSLIERLLYAGVPVLALAEAWWGGCCLAADRVVVQGARFEFERHSRTNVARGALVALAFDLRGEPVDLVAFRGGPGGFVASWLGNVGLLGEEQVDMTHDLLTVHADPLSWLRAGRAGVVVVDPVRDATLLREAGPLAVATHAERRRLTSLLTVPLPRIFVMPELARRDAA